MNKIALITGATAGIGEATAELFAQNQWNVIITGRRQERLTALANRLITEYGIEVKSLNFDVSNLESVKEHINTLPKKWQQIAVLVNNAGLAVGKADFQDGDINDWEVMIDTNVKGLLYISRLVAPIMIENGTGHIINVSSIAGKQVYAKGNVYCSTKHAVDALCKAMRIDLAKHSIRVTSINPGAVDTEFSIVRFKGDETAAKKVYEGYTPLYAEDIADTIFYAATRPPHVTINELIIMPTAQPSAYYLERNKV